MRKKLNVEPEKQLLILIGILERYKGVDNLLMACEKLPSNIAIRIAGNCRDPYKSELASILSPLKAKGIDVDISFGFMQDELFSNYLYAADFFIYPCREINNSGSLNAALTAGLPLIVPAMGELEWIPDNCKILLSPSDSPIESIQNSFNDICRLSSNEIEQIKINNEAWSESRSWEKCSYDYSAVYRGLLNE
jgi:glycosyltransferase involved in cell wall biosynthesis